MTELRINGYEQVQNILQQLYPFLKFKKEQVRHLFRALNILSKKRIDKLTKREKMTIVRSLISARAQSYQSGQKKLEKLEHDLKVISNLSSSP